MSFLYFLLLLGALVFIHELGHFIVAKLSDVRVDAFSLGFGPALLKKKWGETEYRISIIPLGGYVKMLGEDPEMDALQNDWAQKDGAKDGDTAEDKDGGKGLQSDELSKTGDVSEPSPASPQANAAADESPSSKSRAEGSSLERLRPGDKDYGRALNHKPIWKRTLIVVAGPVFNLILPFVIFFFMFLGDSQLLPSVIGSVQKNGPGWNAGLRAGDEVVAIEGQQINYWWQFQKAVDEGAGTEMTFTVRRDGKVFDVKATPEPEEVMKLKQVGLTQTHGRVKVAPHAVEARVWVRPDSPAQKAGLRTFDRIVSVNGDEVTAWHQVESHLAKGQPLKLVVARPDESAEPEPGEIAESAPFTVALQPTAELGLDSFEMAVFSVEEGSAAEQIGLQKGDRIVSLEGQDFLFFELMLHHLAQKVGDDHTLVWEGPDGLKTASFVLTAATEKGEFNEERQVVKFGAQGLPGGANEPALIDNEKRLAYAMHQTWSKSTEAFMVTGASIYGLFAGKVPVKDLGGPILIYDMAAKTSEYGWEYFANVMAWLSISLGIVNLLPIPMMDGGHLMFFAIEAVIRRPVPIRVREIASYIGLAIIGLLMITVFFNDIVRKWGLFEGWF